MRDLFSGTRYELPRADPAAHHYDIAPDGREIAFTFDPAADKRFDHENQIVALDLRSGRFRSLTARSPLNHEYPRYSPDGTRIALLTQNLRRNPVAEQKLAFIDRRRGTVEVVRARWDRSIRHPPRMGTRAPIAVVFPAEDGARTHICFAGPSGRGPRKCWRRGGTVGDFDAAAGAVAFVRNNMGTPPAVFWSAPGAAERRIDGFNAGVMDGVKLGEVREFTIEGWGREQVHMWAIYPPDFDPGRSGRCCTTSTAGPIPRGATTSISAGTTTSSPPRDTSWCA